jgi:hypothetical protein
VPSFVPGITKFESIALLIANGLLLFNISELMKKCNFEEKKQKQHHSYYSGVFILAAVAAAVMLKVVAEFISPW